MIGCNIDKMKIEVMKMMRSQAFKTSTGKISNARNVELSDNNIITVSYGNNRGGYSAARKQTDVIYNNIINKLKEENLPVGKDYEYVIETTSYNDKVIELQLRIPSKLITLYELRNKTEEGEYESLQQAIREYNRNKITQEDTSMDKGIGIDYFGDNIKGQKLNTYPTDNLSKKTKKVLDFVLKNFPKIANNTIIHRNQKEFDDLTANTEFENTRGIYAFDDETGLIHIYINPSKENAETFVHETVHAFTEVILNNPQTPEEIKFVHLVNDLYSQFRKIKGAEKLNDGYQFKDISEFLVYSLTNTEMQEFIKSNNTSKSLLEKVINFIKSLFGLTQSQFDELFNSFKSAVSTTDYSKIKERILKSNLETKGQLSESELRILKPVIEKFETDIRELNTFNIRELQAEKNEQQGKPVSVKETEFLKSSKFSDGYILNLGSPSSILRKIGMPNLPITLGTRWFLDHIIRNPEHNLKLLNLRGLVEAIHNPIAILQDKAYKGKDGRIETLTTVESRDGKPVNVIIQFNKRFGELEVNSITTAFETDLFRFQKATRENSVLYIDKERITNYLQGVLLPSTLQKITDQKGILVYPKSISDSSTNVEKFLHYVDNFPNILTTEEKNKQVRISKGQNINPTEVKPEIEELFNENPTLANKVYEALGFITKSKIETTKTPSEIRNELFSRQERGQISLAGEDIDIISKSRNNPTEENIQELKKLYNYLIGDLQDTITNEITPQQKATAQQLYAQYLSQNPNGSVEGFKSWVANNQSNVQYQKQTDLQAEQDIVLEEFANSLSERFNISFDLISEEEAKSISHEYTSEPAFFDPKTKKAYLVKGKANKTSAIHEIFTHPFLLQIEKTNPTLYKSLLKEAKNNKSVVDYVDNLYGTNQNNDHEYITRAIDLAVQGELDRQKDKTLLGKIQDFFNQLSDYLKKLFNIPKVFSSSISPNITLQQLTQFAMYGKGKMNLNPAQENIEYSLKATNVIVKNLDKIKQWESNKSIDQNTLWDKIQGLGIPKEQIELIKNSEGNTVEEKLLDFANRMSYAVEINTAKENKVNQTGNINKQEWDIRVQELANQGLSVEERRDVLEKEFNTSSIPTQHYSNLTVPGGTNGTYREQNFETPLIKVPKSHAQFNTENTIGFSRNDDRQVYVEKDINSLLEIMQKSGILEVKC